MGQAGADRPACPACSRRSSSSSSSSSASRTSSSRSSSRSTSRSRRGGGYYRSGRHARSRSRSWSRSRSRSRRYSRSRSRGRRHSAGGSRDGHRYSRSPARRGGYGPRRRSRCAWPRVRAGRGARGSQGSQVSEQEVFGSQRRCACSEGLLSVVTWGGAQPPCSGTPWGQETAALLTGSC